MLRRIVSRSINQLPKTPSKYFNIFRESIVTNKMIDTSYLTEYGFNFREDINFNIINNELRLRIADDQYLERLYLDTVTTVDDDIFELSVKSNSVVSDMDFDDDKDLFLSDRISDASLNDKGLTYSSNGRGLTHVMKREFSNSKLQSTKKEISTGGDFENLVTKSSIFVDKSLFIKEVIDDPSEVILITMPRRWGKSLNLDMLKRFLSIDHPEKDINNKLFAGGETETQEGFTKIKKNIPVSKLIESQPNAIKVQGAYPVISIDFKDCKADSFDDTENGTLGIRSLLKNKITHTIEGFGSTLDNSTKKYGTTHIDVKTKYQELLKSTQNGQLNNSLKELSALLHSHHGKKVWILVDGYDAVINHANMELGEKDIKSISELFKSMYSSVFKGNEYLEKGIATGIQLVAKADAGSGFNNATKYTLQDTKYSQYYGINQEEMNLLINHFNIDATKANEIKYWYNGYSEKVLNEENYIDKYNIWSVVKYLNAYSTDKCTVFKSYWENSGSIGFIQKIFKKQNIKIKIEDLIEDKSISFSFKKEFEDSHFETLKHLIRDNTAANEHGSDLFFSHLFIRGYLTINTQNLDTVSYVLPNKEIQSEMQEKIIDFYKTIYSIPQELLNELITSISDIVSNDFNGNREDFLKSKFQELHTKFSELVSQSKFTNTLKDSSQGIHLNEDSVHSLLNYICFQTTANKVSTEKYVDFYETKSAKTKSGRGKADICVKNKECTKGLIIEVKCEKITKQKNTIGFVLNKALEQAKSYGKLIEDTNEQIYIGINVDKSTKEVSLIGETCYSDSSMDPITFQYSDNLDIT